MAVPRTSLHDDGPEFSRLVYGLWRLAEWDYTTAELADLLAQPERLNVLAVGLLDDGEDRRLEDGREGLLPQPEDRFSLRRALVLLQNNPETGRALAQRARRRAEALRWEHIAAAYEAFLIDSVGAK
jgi:hypothetical protein